MPLNQLYHVHGVAQTKAKHARTAALRAEHASEALRADHRIRTHQIDLVPLIAPCGDKFEVSRADQVQVTSTQFTGGDWRWRLVDIDNTTMVEGGGYRSELACRAAVTLLQARANSATHPDPTEVSVYDQRQNS